MKVYVDKGVCIGCGLCTEIEPSVYRMDDDGLAEAYSEPSGDVEEKTKEAIDSCPVAAIVEE